MKILIMVFILISVASCLNNNDSSDMKTETIPKAISEMDDEKKSLTWTINERKEFRYEPIDSYLEKVNTIEDLISLSENKELMNEIMQYKNENQYAWKRRLLDTLQTCNTIIAFDLNSNAWKDSFIDYVWLKELYSFVLENNHSLETYLDKNWKILKEYQKWWSDDKKDIVLSMFLAWKLDKEIAIKELENLSKQYYEKEKSNSIILKILANKITWEILDKKLCEKFFLDWYKNVIY